jgi:hypothetical protein
LSGVRPKGRTPCILPETISTAAPSFSPHELTVRPRTRAIPPAAGSWINARAFSLH